MTGVQVAGDYSYKTAVTLALMEDSSWYKANYSSAETLCAHSTPLLSLLSSLFLQTGERTRVAALP